MAMEVLYPQDVLAQRLRPQPASAYTHHRRKPHPHTHHHTYNPSTTTTNPSSSSSTCRSTSISNPRPSRKAPAVDQKRRREGSGSPPPPKAAQHPHVTVLRRGESLDSALGGGSRPSLPRKQGPPTAGLISSARGGDLIAPSSWPQPAVAVGDHIYAGSAFTVSPAPSALPLPSFFSPSTKKEDERSSAPAVAVVVQGSVDHSATKDLLRLLRLG